MDYDIKKKTAKYTKNKYEAVIIASKVARKLNLERLAATENIGPDESLPAYKLKVTTEAITDLAEGKVKFRFREDTPHDNEMYPES
jgi:DNA-directed RNA polymerase subunit K/omega